MNISPENTAMARAWQQASSDLDIQFISPFSFTSADGCKFVCAGLLPHFGGPKGTVIFSRFDFSTDEEWEQAAEVAHDLGYSTSGLNPLYYEIYDRTNVIETLNDWGWWGSETEVPPWFGGKVGQHGEGKRTVRRSD